MISGWKANGKRAEKRERDVLSKVMFLLSSASKTIDEKDKSKIL